mmetsp:Transcript_19346/g.48377  ORF Transcript_19346/g.48377 Transcript_19346/m.48377 type:complete len:641 (+) Transcript_19346:1869-3791(+)
MDYQALSGTRQYKRARANPTSNNNKPLGLDGERVLNMTVRDALARYGDKAMEGINKEMKQMTSGGFDVLHPVNLSDLSEDDRKRILPSHMFLKDKFDATGTFEKLKARLVTGKDTTNTVTYEIRSSPTVSADSLKLMCAIAARDKMAVGTADFPGAFLNCVMPREGPQTYIRLNKFLSGVMVAIDPRFSRFVGPSGTMVARLNRALYGCVVAAKLWYELLRKTLESIGFSRSPADMCVFARKEEAGTTMCSVHVDDVKLFAPNAAIRDSVFDKLKQRFPDLKIHVGTQLSYLGMSFNYDTPGEVNISMPAFVESLLAESETTGSAETPAGEDLFEIDEESAWLDEERCEAFHSRAAKLLYLGKLTRGDLLTSTIFLCSRVQAPTQQDEQKLSRVLKYLNATKNLKLTLGARDDLFVTLSVDASYGVHQDGKSHTGAAVSLGRGATHVTSVKQRIVTKASTEAELVGASDMIGQGIWTMRLLESIGKPARGLILEQDNLSTVAMIKNGKPTSTRSRHIHIRYFFIHDRMQRGEVIVAHRPSEELVADLLTKPLPRARFHELRDVLLGGQWDPPLRERSVLEVLDPLRILDERESEQSTASVTIRERAERTARQRNGRQASPATSLYEESRARRRQQLVTSH